MPVPDRSGAVHRHLLRDDAYDALCGAIVNGQLEPGEQLHDAELCAWLKLSRSPVRDALARLQDEGLVESSPQRFTRVTTVQESGPLDAFPVLAALHALAAELAVPEMSRPEIEELRAENRAFLEALDARAPEAAYEADERFHGVFVRMAGNPEISRALARLMPRVHRAERLCAIVLPGRRSLAQHEAIIARTAAGDAARAASATRENWLELGGVMSRSLAAGGRHPASATS